MKQCCNQGNTCMQAHMQKIRALTSTHTQTQTHKTILLHGWHTQKTLGKDL